MSDPPLAETAFRKCEKKYKLNRTKESKRNRDTDTDFSEVVDTRIITSNSPLNARRLVCVHPEKNIFAFSEIGGLYFLPELLSIAEQEALCNMCLSDCCKSPPYPNNITTLNPTTVTQGYELNLRWSTLGFAYNWTTRTYIEEKPSPLPRVFCELSAKIVERIRSVLPPNALEDLQGYEAQSIFVNFYPVGSMMMAHQDISETCLEKPLVSISLGCSAVFLMGGESRDIAPHAFWLRSGDAAVFTGNSRLAFHAVPRIMDDCPLHLQPSCHQLRINVNIRQVFRDKRQHTLTV